MGCFDFLQRDQEIGCLASHILAVVVLRKGQRKGLAFARLHATHSIFKLFEHLAFTDQKLEVFCFAALEGLAIELAFKVHSDAVAVLGRRVEGTLGKAAALLAQDVHRLVDSAVVDFSREFFNLCFVQITDLDFGEHFKHRVKSDFTFRCAFFFGDARLACHPQLGFVGSAGKSFADLVVQHFVLHRVAIALRHHIHGHLARTEAVHFHGASQALEARINLGLDHGKGQAQRDLALELFKGFNGNGHGSS